MRNVNRLCKSDALALHDGNGAALARAVGRSRQYISKLPDGPLPEWVDLKLRFVVFGSLFAQQSCGAAQLPAIVRATAACSGRANLASAILVDPDSVTRWCTGAEPVPPTWCPAIERASGVRCEDLAPAVSWERNDVGEVTGFRLPSRPSAEARASVA